MVLSKGRLPDCAPGGRDGWNFEKESHRMKRCPVAGVMCCLKDDSVESRDWSHQGLLCELVSGVRYPGVDHHRSV